MKINYYEETLFPFSFFDIVCFKPSPNTLEFFGFKGTFTYPAPWIKPIKQLSSGVKWRSKRVVLWPKTYSAKVQTIRMFRNAECMVAIDLSKILCAEGVERSKHIATLNRFCKLGLKYEVKLVLATFAKDTRQMRAAQEMISLGALLGMNRGDAKKSMARLECFL